MRKTEGTHQRICLDHSDVMSMIQTPQSPIFFLLFILHKLGLELTTSDSKGTFQSC